jgi:hypothetical protein
MILLSVFLVMGSGVNGFDVDGVDSFFVRFCFDRALVLV